MFEIPSRLSNFYFIHCKLDIVYFPCKPVCLSKPRRDKEDELACMTHKPLHTKWNLDMEADRLKAKILVSDMPRKTTIRVWFKEKKKKKGRPYWILAVGIEAPLECALDELLTGLNETLDLIQNGSDWLHLRTKSKSLRRTGDDGTRNTRFGTLDGTERVRGERKGSAVFPPSTCFSNGNRPQSPSQITGWWWPQRRTPHKQSYPYAGRHSSNVQTGK